MRNVIIAGTGSYIPETVLTNHELVATLAKEGIDSSDDWIVAHTGIRERRIAARSESTSDLGYKAALKALEAAEMDISDIDLILCATSTPDMYLPSTACVIQGKLGGKQSAAFDVNAACSGFIYALGTAYYYLKAGAYDNALVIGAETYSRLVDWKDRRSCVFFGDGAGAVLLKKSDRKDVGIRGVHLGADGSQGESITARACGAAPTCERGEAVGGNGKFAMNGREVYRFAINAFPEAVEALFLKLDCSPSDVDLLISHQANINIIRDSLKQLGICESKAYINIQRYGNTAAASIPIALDEAMRKGLAPSGSNLLLVGFGGGLTWGAMLISL